MQIQYSQLASLLLDKNLIIGTDECGTGSLAGPLVVCGVKAPKNWSLATLNDSKKLTEKRREAARDQLLKLAETQNISYYITERSSTTIDKFGMAVALKDAYVEVFHALYENNSLIISDGTLKFDGLKVDSYPIVSLIKADAQIPTVMAASILGKTYRDNKMKELDSLFPQYNWKKNVGYPTKEHKDNINLYGPCDLHRFSYGPIKNLKLVKWKIY